ncbi:hypothetical protein CEXT_558871, partial [Caerostris extrusa]
KIVEKNENPSPAENRVRQHKSTYSPPPECFVNEARSTLTKNEKNLSQIERQVLFALLIRWYNRILKEYKSVPKIGEKKKKFTTTEDGFCPISKTWLNISIDSEALIALFSVNLRRMSTTDVRRS